MFAVLRALGAGSRSDLARRLHRCIETVAIALPPPCPVLVTPMHARELIETAALICLRSRGLLDQREPLDEEALSEYWIASRCRLDHWGRLLRSFGRSQTAPTTMEPIDLLSQLSEEITLSEVLSRAIAAVTAAHDRANQTDDSGLIARNVLDAHREAQRRLVALRAAWWPADSPKARLTRSLEKQTHRWTDVLLAYIGSAQDVEPLAFDSSRLREFAYDSQAHGAASSEGAFQLLLFSLRSSFAAATREPVCGDLNRRVAGASIGLFGTGSFDDLGLLRPIWMIRAERTAEDTLAMVDRLFHDNANEEGFVMPDRWHN